MTDDATPVRARLEADLRRPGGGWTTGILTLTTPLIIHLINIAGFWPAPSWTATATMIAFFAAHILWGAYGYYPRRLR